MQYFKQTLYDPLWRSIIRPTRELYSEIDLGPASFPFGGRTVKRTDFEVQNDRSHQIRCSRYFYDDGRTRPTVIFLHGNAGSRLAALRYLHDLLSVEADLVCFDFSGSGLSDGQYISLGKNQQNDLSAVVGYLRREGVREIGLWGKSMGAVTALLYAEGDPNLACLVLDSPFADLECLVKELAQKRGIMPTFVADIALKYVNDTVMEKTGLNIFKLKPAQSAEELRVPSLLVAGKQDEVVAGAHVEQVYRSLGGEKRLLVCEGGHNSERPRFVLDSVLNFLRTNFNLPTKEPTEG